MNISFSGYINHRSSSVTRGSYTPKAFKLSSRTSLSKPTSSTRKFTQAAYRKPYLSIKSFLMQEQSNGRLSNNLFQVNRRCTCTRDSLSGADDLLHAHLESNLPLPPPALYTILILDAGPKEPELKGQQAKMKHKHELWRCRFAFLSLSLPPFFSPNCSYK